MRDEVKGGGVRDWFAVDLRATKQGLGAWTTEQLVDYLGKGFSARAGSFGPMNAVIANSTRHLRSEDLRAIAVYLQSLRGADYAGETVDRRGRASWRLRFTKSTAANAMAPRDAAESSTGRPWPAARSCRARDAASLINIILHGSDKPAGIGSTTWETMPAYAERLDDAEIAALSNFLRASWGNRASPSRRKWSRASAGARATTAG